MPAAPAAVLVQNPPPPPEDDSFATTFDSLMKLGSEQPPGEPTEAAEPPAEAPAVDKAPVEGEPPKPAEALEAPVPGDAPEAPAADAKPADDDVIKRLAQLVKDTPAPQPQAQPQPQYQQPQQQAPEPFTADERTFLENYYKDYSEVAKAEALIRRNEYNDLLRYTFDQFYQQMTPIAQAVKVLSERTQLADLREAIPEYGDDLRNRVIAWAKTQPDYLQPAYAYAIDHGNAEQIRHLTELYRRDNPDAKASSPSRKQTTELPAAAKQAAAALAPVGSKRTAVILGEDPNDFDRAFEIAAKSVEP